MSFFEKKNVILEFASCNASLSELQSGFEQGFLRVEFAFDADKIR